MHFPFMKVKVKSLSLVRLFATPWTVAYQAPPSLSLIHISEPTRRYAISYAVFCLKKVCRIKGAKCPFDLQFLTWDFS